MIFTTFTSASWLNGYVGKVDGFTDRLDRPKDFPQLGENPRGPYGELEDALKLLLLEPDANSGGIGGQLTIAEEYISKTTNKAQVPQWSKEK